MGQKAAGDMLYRNKRPQTGAFLPIVMGHEMSGTIIEIRKDVKKIL